MKYSKEEFINLVSCKYHEPFELIQYTGSAKPGLFKCGYCSNIYSLAKMGKLLNANRKHICTHCFASQYAEQVLELIQLQSTLHFLKFGYATHLHKPTIIYQCKICEQVTEKPYTEFLKYPTCIHCGENAKRRNINTLPMYLPEDFTLVGSYINQYEKTLFKHTCGFIFKVRPKDLLNGHSYCPKCSKKASKGERAIMQYLTDHEIDFVKEKTFAWSDNKRYDFFLPTYNLLIEYNGIQHYHETPYFPLTLEEQQKIDAWKLEQACLHSIDTLVIPYTDLNNIPTILAQRLKENA